MTTRAERINKAIKDKGISYAELEKITGVSKSALQRYASGETKKIPIDAIEKIAAATGTDARYLMCWEENDQPNAQKLPNDFIRMIPVFESASAGFGANAENRIMEFIPIFIQSDSEAANTICVRVCGDSMHPQIQDGDLVQVHKQETAETGDIVVILDGDDAYVKRFIRTPQGITLESFNPSYPPMRFSREESNQLRIVGIVRRIVRDL